MRMSHLNKNENFNACEKIHFPISFVRFKTEKGLDDVAKGSLEVKISEDGQTVNIISDQKPKVFNEFHLMQYLGLSYASD